MFQFKLEKYHGLNSRHTCPNCNVRRKFVRYIDAGGHHLAETVGKCNRESRCGYHFTPKMFFADNPKQNRIIGQGFARKKLSEIVKAKNGIDFIDFGVFEETLSNYEQNSLVKFLCNLFRDDIGAVQNALQKYFVGTWKDGLTIFWQIDQNRKIRTGKIMRYDMQTGKRQTVRTWVQDGETCELKTDWIHRNIKKDFNLKQCFFGEHLLQKESGKQVAIVEAEKTALICSICFPEMIWLAMGAKGYLTLERFQTLPDRKILLYPDADAYSDWKEKAIEAQRKGFDVRVSNLIETNATEAEKQNGFDLADYLIAEIKTKAKSKDAYESLVIDPHFTGWTNASLFD